MSLAFATLSTLLSIALVAINDVMCGVSLGEPINRSLHLRHVTTHTCSFSPGSHFDGHVTCSHRKLTDVPRDLPPNTTSLDLSDNVIAVLSNTSLCGLTSLEILDLRSNVLAHLEAGAFSCTPSLGHLDLSQNRLRLDYTAYPRGVFSPLGLLHQLFIDKNHHDVILPLTYPDDVFLPLVNLTELHLDILPGANFGDAFSKLVSLKVVAFSSRSTIKLTNETFQGFSGSFVESFNANGIRITDIEANAFSHFRHLRELNIRGGRTVDLFPAIRSLYGLRGRNLSVVNFGSTNRVTPRAITGPMIVFLSMVCVEELILQDNTLYNIAVSPPFRDPLTRCLKKLDLSENDLQGPKNFPYFFRVFSNLQYLDLSNKRRVCPYNFDETPPDSSGTKVAVRILFPDTLEYLDMAHTLHVGGHLVPYTIDAKSLRYLNFSCNGLDYFMAPIRGLENLEVLDFSDNDMSRITPDFFDHFPQVQKLVLRNARLDQHFLMVHGERLFRPLLRMTELDLTGNDLQALPSGVLRNIRSFVAARNRFTGVPLELPRTSHLRHIDLSSNAIALMTSRDRRHLDVIAAKHDVTLRLHGNPLQCDCAAWAFVDWLQTTDVNLDKGGNYSCLSERYVLETTADVMSSYDVTWRRCQGQGALQLSSELLVVLLMLLVLAFFVVRFKTNLLHVLLRMAGKGENSSRREDHAYDVYVCYSEQDYRFVYGELRHRLEQQAGLRLFLRERDTLPGGHVAEDIVEGVERSWRVAFLLTPAFLQDPWCDFTVSTGVRSVTGRNPGRLLLLLLEPLCQADLPRRLLNAASEDAIFDLTSASDDSLVWSRLVDCVMEK